MSKYDFDTIIDRRGSGAMKWDHLPTQYGEIIPMSLADMDFKLPPEVLDALQKRIDHGIFGYVGMEEKDYQAIHYWMETLHGQKVPREWILPGPGVVPTMRAAHYVLTKPGDKVVVQPPVHTPFFTTATRYDREQVTVPLLRDENNRYTMDYDGLEKAFADGAKLMLICSPQNPMGRVWSRAELERLSELCIHYNVYVISDEIHRDILMPGTVFTPFSEIPGMAERTVEVFSLSKTFNMGGFHISTAVIADQDIKKAVDQRLRDLGVPVGRPTLMSITAQTAAYTYGREWVKELCEYLSGNFDAALEILKDTPLKAFKPEGTYMLWTDCSALKMNTDELQQFMVEKAHVYPELGSIYDSINYASYKGPQTHMRLNVGMPRELVVKAMTSIRDAVCGLDLQK